MAKVLVRDLEPAVVERLKARAAQHGRSLQKELKAILEEAAGQPTWAEACAPTSSGCGGCSGDGSSRTARS